MAKTKAVSHSSADYGALEWLRAHRIELAPAYVGLPVLSAGVLGNIFLGNFQRSICVAAILVAAATWIGTRVHQTWRRIYLGVITLAAVGWILYVGQIEHLRDWQWPIVALFAGSILMAVPYWMDRVKRTQVTMENMVRDWPIRSGRIGLQNTSIVNVKMSEIGWTAKLQWAPGEYLTDRVRKQEQEIEGALNLQRGQLKVSFNGKANDSVILNVTLRDPHERGILWEPDTQALEDGSHELKVTHGADAFTIGLRTDGTEKKLRLFVPGWGARQTLIAGMKGSGKSGLLNRIWAHLALSDDVVQLGIDLKGGVELGPWRKLFHRIATSRAEAIEMIKMVEMLIDQRNRLMAQRGWKSWKGSPENPWVCLSIDEAASLLGGSATTKEIDRIAEICRKGRAAGIAVIFATQYPTLEALGSSQIRAQIDQRFCFRMSDPEGETYIITAGTVNAHKIDSDRPGTCYFQDGDKLDPLSLRVSFVPDGSGDTYDLIADLVSVLAGTTPEMDEASISEGIAQLEWYANSAISLEDEDSETDEEGDETETETEEVPIPEQFDPDAGDVSLAEVIRHARSEMTQEQRDEMDRKAREAEEAEEARRLSPEGARQAVLDALTASGPEGVPASELAKVATRRSSWVYNLLDELEQDGRVRRTGAGGWAWCAEEAHAG